MSVLIIADPEYSSLPRTLSALSQMNGDAKIVLAHVLFADVGSRGRGGSHVTAGALCLILQHGVGEAGVGGGVAHAQGP
jgi:hypothetical protein